MCLQLTDHIWEGQRGSPEGRPRREAIAFLIVQATLHTLAPPRPPSATKVYLLIIHDETKCQWHGESAKTDDDDIPQEAGSFIVWWCLLLS